MVMVVCDARINSRVVEVNVDLEMQDEDKMTKKETAHSPLVLIDLQFWWQ